MPKHNFLENSQLDAHKTNCMCIFVGIYYIFFFKRIYGFEIIDFFLLPFIWIFFLLICILFLCSVNNIPEHQCRLMHTVKECFDYSDDVHLAFFFPKKCFGLEIGVTMHIIAQNLKLFDYYHYVLWVNRHTVHITLLLELLFLFIHGILTFSDFILPFFCIYSSPIPFCDFLNLFSIWYIRRLNLSLGSFNEWTVSQNLNGLSQPVF